MVALFPPHQLQTLLLPLLLHIHLIEQYNRDIIAQSQRNHYNLQRNSSRPTTTTANSLYNNNVSTALPTRRPQHTTLDNPKRQSLFAEDEYIIGLGLGDITGPAVDVNVLNLMRQIIVGSPTGDGSSALNQLVKLQHPQLRELTDLKLQVKVNFNPLLLRLPQVQTLFSFSDTLKNLRIISSLVNCLNGLPY